MTEQEKEQVLEDKAKQYAEIFNGFRMRFCNSRMNGAALSELLEKMNFPKNEKFRKILSEYKIIIKNGNRRNCIWTLCTEPVHFEKFKNVLKDWGEYNKTKNKKYYYIKKSNTSTLTEEKAIVFLKSLGYRIQKRVIKYEEI